MYAILILIQGSTDILVFGTGRVNIGSTDILVFGTGRVNIGSTDISVFGTGRVKSYASETMPFITGVTLNLDRAIYGKIVSPLIKHSDYIY